jgi:hypothetical protein
LQAAISERAGQSGQEAAHGGTEADAGDVNRDGIALDGLRLRFFAGFDLKVHAG